MADDSKGMTGGSSVGESSPVAPATTLGDNSNEIQATRVMPQDPSKVGANTNKPLNRNEDLEDLVGKARIIHEIVIAPPKPPGNNSVPPTEQTPTAPPPEAPSNQPPPLASKSEVIQALAEKAKPTGSPILLEEKNLVTPELPPAAPEPPDKKLEDAPAAGFVAQDVVISSPNLDEPKAYLPSAPITQEGNDSIRVGDFSGPKDEIQKILKEVKLPERTVLPDHGEKKKTEVVFDTSLTSSLSDVESVPAHPPTPGNPQSSTVPIDQAARTISGEVEKEVPENSTSIVTPLRTLKNDFQKLIREKKMSLVRVAALEQDKRRDSDRMSAHTIPTRKRHRVFSVVFAVIILTILGSAAFFGVALVTREQGGVTLTSPETSLLFTETTFPLPLANLSAFDIKELLAQMRTEATATLGSITRIVPAVSEEPGISGSPLLERAATLEEFWAALDVRASPDLLRALDSEFFFGIHTVDENAPLFVIPVISYERAFAGMLEWENTINADLIPAFTPVSDTQLGADGLIKKRQFEDVVMRNYDVRALKDDASTIQLYYSFPTRNILIIAESPYSFAEVLSRLRAERKL